MDSLLPIWHAARFWKNIPLLLIYFSGLFLVDNDASWHVVLMGAIVLMSASFYMTHLNVITDHELDKAKKPDLYNALNQNMRLSKNVMAFEFLLSIFGLVGLWILGYGYAALALLVFFIVTIIYSYNFITFNSPAKHRLKVYWWGHIIVLILGYLALWLAGYFIAKPLVDDSLPFWVVLFSMVSLSEYSLFLLESSIDHKEEKEHKLKSMSALIGDKATNTVSLLLGILALAMLLCIPLWFDVSLHLLLAAFLPPMILRVAFEFYVLLSGSFTKRHYLKFHVPDILYLGTRLYTLAVIAYFHFLS
ncbi:hypothetical protein BH09BAC1_BH09BAC1_14000 [soil metagenome]